MKSVLSRIAFLFLATTIVVTVSGCLGTEEWRATRTENINNIKKSCVEANGKLTVSYEVGSFSSVIHVTCEYPVQVDPALNLMED